MTDVFFSFKKHFGKHLIIILLVIAGLLSMGYILNNNWKTDKASEDFDAKYIADENGEKHFYKVTEALPDDVYYEYMNDNGEIYDKWEKLYYKLLESKDFNYISENFQFVEVEEHGSETQKEIYEQYKSFEGRTMMPSSDFYEYFSIELSEGNSFSQEEMIYNEKKIPVILGADYKKTCNIGDVFKGRYITSQDNGEELIEFEVVGFLKENQFFFNIEENDFVSCNRYIFLPPMKMLDKSKEARILLLCKFYGIIDSNLEWNEMEEKFNSLKKEVGLENYELGVVDKQLTTSELSDEDSDMGDFDVETEPMLKQYSSMTHAIAKQYAILSVVVLTFAVITISMLMSGILRDNFYKFGVKKLCGAPKKSINAEAAWIVALPILIGDGIATVVLFGLGLDLVAFAQVQAVTAGIIFITVLAGLLYIRRFKVHEIISKE